jgi:N-acetylmuramoyl-L-alanine amidase
MRSLTNARWSAQPTGLLLIGLLLAAVGCAETGFSPSGGPVLDAPQGSVSAYQLAGRLRLEVNHSSATMATLRNAGNVVTIFPDPNGQAYVNGKPVGHRGGVKPVGGILFVPLGMEEAISAALRPRREPRRRTGPRPEPNRLSGMRVVVDAGHGGRDPGAISVLGFPEKDVVLPVSLEVARLLRAQGVDVRLTRKDDRFIELNERADMANRLKADLFVSVHADSCGKPSPCGFSMYVARAAGAASCRAAKTLRGELAELGLKDRGVRRADFRVLVRTACPAVLVELGFLSNPAEARQLKARRHQDRLAAAIAEGIISHLSNP